MAVGLMAAAIAVCCVMAPAASARVVFDKVTRQWFGIVPPPPRPSLIAAQSPLTRLPASGTPTCSTTVDPKCASLMTLHGGLVQHAENVILFFWDPNGFSAEPGYVTDMQKWLSSVAAGDYSTGNTASAVGNPLSVTQQYYDMSGPGGSKNFVSYGVKALPYVMDTDAYPASDCTDTYTDFYSNPPNQSVTLPMCLTAGKLLNELNTYVTNHHLPRGINTEYFILTPPGLGSCDDTSNKTCAIAQYCGWHTDLPSNSGPSGELVYANMPWLTGTNCDVNRALTASGTPSPNLYTSGIDPVVGTFSHELAESMTDPNPDTGWFGSGGGADEIGDKCGYQYAVGNDFYDMNGVSTTAGGAYYNTTLNSNNYLLQMEFDNSANSGTGGCNQWDTDTQPTASIAAPAHPVSGTPASFSLSNVVDPAGIAYVNWNFGDGTMGRSSATAPISHTFAVGGARTVTAIVTDNHGNEVKETAPLTVAQGPATIALKLSTQHPAPNGSYTLKLTGFARPGGILGSTHNRSELDLFEQAPATCQSTRKAEQAKVAAGKAARKGQWFVPAGAFAESQLRQALGGQHKTEHFCGYVSRSATLTDAKASSFYTTT
jgi:hypothetical protein